MQMNADADALGVRADSCLGTPFQASCTCLRVLGRGLLFKFRLIAVPSCAHFKERLGSATGSAFQKIEIVRAFSTSIPSRHSSPRGIQWRKLASGSENPAGRPAVRQGHTKCAMTAPYAWFGHYAAATASAFICIYLRPKSFLYECQKTLPSSVSWSTWATSCWVKRNA